MDQKQFDGYRQNVWNQGAAIVDEHDRQASAGTLTNVSVNGLISRLEALLSAFEGVYQASRSPKGPVAPSWIDSRFHDYYDFFAKILGAWRAELIPDIYPGLPGGGAGGGLPGGPMRTIYRMILFVPDRGVFGTSGSYPDCTPETPGGCRGQEFPTIAAVVDYAKEHGEVPVYIDLDYDAGVEEAWRMAAGGSPQAPKSYIVEGVDAKGNPVLKPGGFSLASLAENPVMLGLGIGLLAVVLGGRKKGA